MKPSLPPTRALSVTPAARPPISSVGADLRVRPGSSAALGCVPSAASPRISTVGATHASPDCPLYLRERGRGEGSEGLMCSPALCSVTPGLVAKALFTITVLIVLATLARAEELSLTVPGLPSGATAFAVTGIEKPLPATRGGDVFTWRSLAPGTYSIELKIGSTDVIGVDMRIRDAAGNATEPGAISSDAESAIRDYLAHTEDFFASRRIALLAGSGDAAVALVENIQDGSKTSDEKLRGKSIFRLDLWDFQKSYGSWRRTKTRTVLRRTIDSAELTATTFVYSRELGGIEIAPKQSRHLDFSFPSSPSGDKEKK
jgi:hypothetical protein